MLTLVFAGLGERFTQLMLGGLFSVDDGVQEKDGAWDMVPAVASIFITWLRAHGSATDLGGLAALLQARPIEGISCYLVAATQKHLHDQVYMEIDLYSIDTCLMSLCWHHTQLTAS